MGLVSQIEGILAEHSNVERFLKKETLRRGINHLLPSNQPISSAGRETIEKVLIEGFGNYNDYNPLLKHLNRDAIMHGVNVNFGTQSNSLKAILLLDSLIRLIADRIYR